MVRQPSAEETDRRIEQAEEVLDANPTMALATVVNGEPWVGFAFFVTDEPASGGLDLCCALALGPERDAVLAERPAVAFCVGGDEADRWVQGTGVAELCADDAETSAILKRLGERVPQAGPFLSGLPAKGVRIRVRRLKLVDTASQPPVTEFSFT